jgi:ADP-ribose pyrophosphatase YjhB (NUDIX family)
LSRPPASGGGFARLLPDYARTAWLGLFGHLWRGPRRVVQGVVLSEAGVLLSVRVDLRGWELPGGAPTPGEEEPAALVREVREETGVEVEVERLTGEYHRHGFLPHVARVYRCRAVGGAPRPSPETPQVRWWRPEALPSTLLPWYRTPLLDALGARGEPVVRHERQGLAAIWAGMRIDLRMRLSGDRAR